MLIIIFLYINIIMIEFNILFALALSLPSIFLFSYLISSPHRKVLIRNAILFLDLFGIIFLIFLVIEIKIPLKLIIETNLFLFQIISFLILGINLVFYYFFQEENYKHFVDFFFTFPLAILFSMLISAIYIFISYYYLVSTLKNIFFTFLLIYSNLVGFILLAYYLTEIIGEKNLYLRCIGGILLLISSFLYILLIPLVA